MFYYFGFGSNMSIASLQAKGVVPIKSQPARLRGWRLCFNVKHFFRNEGGVGNIEYTGDDNDLVLGILHECSDEALEPLDATEAYGYGYDRIKISVEVILQQPQVFSALTYVGMPEFIDNSCLPSQRYLNILLSGAQQAGLDIDYINKLKTQQVFIPKDYLLYTPPEGDYPTFDANTLTKYPMYTALLGYVFDMADARVQHEYLKTFFGGQDMTLFHLKRLDSSKSEETLDDIKYGRLNCAQRKYLNSFLNEYAVEYRFVGNFNYHHE